MLAAGFSSLAFSPVQDFLIPGISGKRRPLREATGGSREGAEEAQRWNGFLRD
jgi:hypothetical protein